ncbi:hypothetical protein VdG1_06793 [Verticillium dahliae VDG1]|nr:hypothetical protein VdG1_06793 [Verticillium dahliae VDG1]
MPSAIVTGATVYALSRSKKGAFPANAQHKSIDLTGSADDMAASLEGVQAEYVFFAAYLEQDTEQKAWDVNGAMLESFLAALERTGAARSVQRVFVGEGEDAGSKKLNDPSPLSVFEAESGLKGKVEPGNLEYRVDLVKWSQRDGVKEAWERLAEREGLDKEAFEKATWGFLVFILGRAYDLVISMSKAREIGWTGYKDTWKAFSDVFGQLEAEKVLPKTH